MNLLQRHLKVIQAHQPQAWQGLKDIYDSTFELEDGELLFLGRSWKASEMALNLPLESIGVMLYGMGDGTLLKRLLTELAPDKPVLVFDSQPELAWACLNESDLSEALSDPRLQWFVGKPDTLVISFAKARLQLQDRLGLTWLENPLTTQIAQLFNDPFLTLFRHEAGVQNQHLPLENLLQLKALFQDLSPDMTQAYTSYPLSCRNGCSDCCETTIGYHLCVNPLEWALLHQTFCSLEKTQRQQIFERAVHYLAPRQAYLTELLHTFDSQPERIQASDFQLELLEKAQEQGNQDCIFLGPERGCQIYEGRPLTCRIFGNSHIQHHQTFTCDKDAGLMEKILLDEGNTNKLVNSSLYRRRLWELHEHLPYKQVLNLWILTHLDFSKRDFKPLRIDYQQFQTLIRHPETLDDLLNQLKQAAQVSGATETP